MDQGWTVLTLRHGHHGGSGFEVRRNGPPAAEPSAPKGLAATLSAHPGKAELTWEPVKEAATYHVQVNRTSPDEASAWELIAVTTRSRSSIAGLSSAKVHWFRVAAIGTKGMGPWSDVAHTLIRRPGGSEPPSHGELRPTRTSCPQGQRHVQGKRLAHLVPTTLNA